MNMNPPTLDAAHLTPAVAAPLAPLMQRFTSLWDAAAAGIDEGDALGAFRLLGAPLSALWAEARGSLRDDEAKALARAHRLHALVQQDPYTDRARRKPRGYAGDAVMMDYVYSGTAPEGTSALGRQIMMATTRCPMGLSVRYRRVLLRSLIDDAVASVAQPRMLSVASGHCRELDGSLVQNTAFDGEFVALDQDPLSCAEVARCQSGFAVRVVEQGVRELLARGAEGAAGATLGSFDLIYSAGLYDYLPEPVARRLTAHLLQMLRPGGQLLVANFVPTGSGRGYMELFMDWPLIVRSEHDMRALCERAGGTGLVSFHDPHRNVVYVQMSRARPATP
jgi:extracellular factor (EF) 3-hydroxypalmitic acid methyl ester biosynthesis protein